MLLQSVCVCELRIVTVVLRWRVMPIAKLLPPKKMQTYEFSYFNDNLGLRVRLLLLSFLFLRVCCFVIEWWRVSLEFNWKRKFLLFLYGRFWIWLAKSVPSFEGSCRLQGKRMSEERREDDFRSGWLWRMESGGEGERNSVWRLKVFFSDDEDDWVPFGMWLRLVFITFFISSSLSLSLLCYVLLLLFWFFGEILLSVTGLVEAVRSCWRSSSNSVITWRVGYLVILLEFLPIEMVRSYENSVWDW